MAKSSCALALSPVQAAPAATRPTFTIPDGARAVLVYRDHTGELNFQPVARDESVLNIERDLLKHLNESPRSTEWLQVLRAYCDQRLAVREKAQATGCVVTPSPVFDWDMTRLAALRGVQS